MTRIVGAALMAATLLPVAQARAEAKSTLKGVALEDLTWVEAEKRLTSHSVMVIPLGAAAKEHGPHLKLSNDYIIAEYLKKRVLERLDIVVAPTLNYGFYPAFHEYPGSTSLSLPTSRNAIVDICRSLAEHGPRRFYVLNTGVSTLRALEPAAGVLAGEGILLRYMDILKAVEPVEKAIAKQARGTHADEIETSLMLYIAPATVDMRKAVKDGVEKGGGMLTRDPDKPALYSPSGVFGDATLATRAKGKKVMAALIEAASRDIEALRHAPLPVALSAAALDDYVGEYEVALDDVITITRQDRSLLYERTGRPKVVLSRETRTRFAHPSGADIVFMKDAAGHVTHLYMDIEGKDLLARRVK